MDADEYILISGLQHFSYCRRQWALIHVEQQWSENILTAEGRILHERVHDIHAKDVRNGVITMRDFPVKSDALGVTGRCDAIEFTPCENGVTLHGRCGQWKICPVEYKHGQEKASDCDRLQVVAQVICLEEMFSCEITEGAIFYYETRRKEKFEITPELRTQVSLSFQEMHNLFRRGHTPIVKKRSGCRNCSLKEICLPTLQRETGFPSVSKYMQSMVKENDT